MSKKIFVVLDTNVLVSALLKRESLPDIVVDKAVNGEIIPVLNEEIINEYDEVLHRKKFHIAQNDIDETIDGLKERGIFLNPAEEITDKVLHDKDVVFYAVTMEARKYNKTYLVTGNKKHFPVKPYVVNPHEFLTILPNIQSKSDTD